MLAAERIRRSAGLYSGTLDAFGLSPVRRQSLIEEFAGRIEEFDASYVEEMRGIAKGADVPFEQIVMINARTEVVAMARAETGSPDPEEQDDGCTGALIMPAKSASGNLVHGQNW
ncbi:MAG: acyl-CoA--6-aminopenicillanic acid acyltransferase, partial [Brucella intermedia]